jgi:hypothetical protein
MAKRNVALLAKASMKTHMRTTQTRAPQTSISMFSLGLTGGRSPLGRKTQVEPHSSDHRVETTVFSVKLNVNSYGRSSGRIVASSHEP